MEELFLGAVAATALMSLFVALSVEAWAKPLIDKWVKDEQLHDWSNNIAAFIFGMGYAYLGAFILEQLGLPQLIARAGLQGAAAALGATFGYDVWKNRPGGAVN